MKGPVCCIYLLWIVPEWAYKTLRSMAGRGRCTDKQPDRLARNAAGQNSSQIKAAAPAEPLKRVAVAGPHVVQ